jgi:cell division septum initiation protein DivIVA
MNATLIIQWLFNNKKLLAILGAAGLTLGSMFYIKHLRSELSSLETEYTDFKKQARINEQRYRIIVTSLEAKAADERIANEYETSIKEDVLRNRTVADRNVSPALRSALAGLQQYEAKRTSGASKPPSL